MPEPSPAAGADAVLCTAADAAFFPLLEGLLGSLDAAGLAGRLPLGVLDIGLAEGQRAALRERGARLVEPGWDVRLPPWAKVSDSYRSLAARPHLPRHFPGFATYLWVDADAWVQDASAVELLLATARRGKWAVVPELDRGYWTTYKPPKLWGQNQRAFAWAYGLRAGHKFGRNPVLNGGVWALRGDAPQWAEWAAAHQRALSRPRLLGRSAATDGFKLSEQTAMNLVAWKRRGETALLPATANWFCGKGTPMWDAERRMLVEPHPPHAPLGIVHLAGPGMKERVWELPVLQGGAPLRTRLQWADVAAPRRAAPAPVG